MTKQTKPGAKPPEKKARTDWDAVERDYRTTNQTNAELGRRYGVSDVMIGKMARKGGWKRDLTTAVRQATNARLIEESVREKVREGSDLVRDTVLAVAEVNTGVTLKHRRDIESARLIGVDLLVELQETKMLVEDKELLAQILAGSGASPKSEAEARSIVKRALDVGGRVASLKALAETFTKLQAAERVAFGLNDGGGKEDDAVTVVIKDMTGRKTQ
jgi:hypothetical protein